MKHCPEPWTRRPVPEDIPPYDDGYDRIVDANGHHVATVPHNTPLDDNDHGPANTERITACVNACAGIPTDKLVDKQLKLVDAKWPAE